MTRGASDPDPGQPLLYLCYAPADDAWVHGRMVHELGLKNGQYRTRADDRLGELQLHEIASAVEECRFTVLIASSAARWDKLAQFAAGLAQHAGVADEHDAPRLVIVARDFALGSGAELPLEQRALVGLDCSDEAHTVEALARLRKILALEPPIDERPACPYPGLERFTAANRDLLFGRDGDKHAILQRLRACHTRILVVGPSGSGKSSLIHAAVLPELAPRDHVVQVVPRGGDLAAALRATIDALEVPKLGTALDHYVRTVPGATDAEIEHARTQLRATPIPDERRRVVVIDPLEEIFASDDADARETLLHLLSGLWSLPWCTVIMCMRADFYGAVMALRCWRELESSQYPVPPLDEAGLVAAIVEPANHAGVHVDAALVERLIREIDRDRSSVPLPLLQVALKELWAHLRWRYLAVADYEHIVNHDQRGLGAVLAVHAEAVVQALTGPGDRAVAQRILLDLVHLGEGRPHTRRRRTLDDLRRSGDAPDQLERVLERLVQGRLVTTSDGDHATARGDARRTRGARIDSRGEPAAEVAERHVDLAHDTLITGWPALAGWIVERRDDLRTQRRFDARAAAGGLLNAAELSELTHWIATPTGVALGASEAVRTLVRRSASARRFRRGAFGAGVLAMTATAIVFAVQTRQLREEQTKTRKSISKATEAAKLVVFELDDKLKTVACAGAAKVRETSLKSARALLGELRTLGDLDEDEQRTETFGKTAQADFALERGRLEEAYALYKDVLADAERRAASDPSNAGWQRDLAGAYQKLGEVAVIAGKLDDARSWFDKAVAVRKTLAAATDASALQRDVAASYEKLADVVMTAGKLDDARIWFEKALMVRRRFAAADPSNTGWQRDLSTSYERLGVVALTAGKLDDARTWFDKALAVRETLANGDPSNARFQRELSVSYENLGDVAAVTAGKLDEARIWFEKALVIGQTLAAADPSNAGRQRDLSVHYSRLGDVTVSAGKLEEARVWFEKAVAVTKTLAAEDPSNTGWQSDLSVGYQRLGDVANIAGKLDDARDWFEQVLAVRTTLAAADPSNVIWKNNLAATHARLGNIAMTAGKLDDARIWFEKALAVHKTLATVDPSNADWQRNLGISYNKLGEVAVTAGQLDAARAWFEQAHAVAKTILATDPNNTDSQRDLSIYDENLGDIDVSAGKLDAAWAWFEQARTIREDLAADPSNVSGQSDLSASYQKLGEVAVTFGKLDDGRTWFEKALAIRKPLAAANPSDADWQSGLSASCQSLGDLAMTVGRRDQARDWFDKALAIRKPLAASSPGNAEWQRDLCSTLTRMASAAPTPDEAMRYRRDARVIYEQLQQRGLFRGDRKFARLGAELDQAGRGSRPPSTADASR
jgi:tetratricopeptide (TPR) repeat protein